MCSRLSLLHSFRVVTPSKTLAMRTFTTSAQHHKTVTNHIKDAAKTVDKTVSKGAIKGLDGLEKVNEGVKNAAEKVGIRLESEPDPLLHDLEDTNSASTSAQDKSEPLKRHAKGGNRDQADVKNASR